MERVLRETLVDGSFGSVTSGVSSRMKEIRGAGNRTTEARLRAALVRRRIRGWHIQTRSIAGKPDFFFPSRRIAVFVDGCFWHGCPECGHIPGKNREFWKKKIERNRFRDERTIQQLTEQHIEVMRFWEHQLSADLAGCVSSLELLIRKNRHDA